MFLVTTDVTRVKALTVDRVFMVDGTVPGWAKADQDYHADHHRPGGPAVQLADLIDTHPPYPQDTDLIVTTQLDADACVAAAYLLLPEPLRQDKAVQQKFAAIAWDCDHLYVPDHLAELATFGAKAVAALKVQGNEIAAELGLPTDRTQWSVLDHERYASHGFEWGTRCLVAAAQGDAPWPGELGEADDYWQAVEAMAQQLIDQRRVIPVGRSVLYSSIGIPAYVDPRATNLAIKRLGILADFPVVLRVGEFHRQEHIGLAYTLGSNPQHPLARRLDYSALEVWQSLTELEALRRGVDPTLVRSHWEDTLRSQILGFDPWGGRAAVGGSGWNTPSYLLPHEVIEQVEEILGRVIN